MSSVIKKSLAKDLAATAIEAAWIQWHALGSRITTSGAARSMIDPEALVLASLALRDHERRLWEVLASWIEQYSTTLSVQRMKNLAAMYPQSVRDHLAEAARIAFDKGGDYRWRSLAGGSEGPHRRAQDLAAPKVGRWDETALVVRLRMGIGVGTQADILVFLLARRGDWVSASEIVDALGYNVYSVRRAADRMAHAQLILSTSGKPIRYRADDSRWSGALGLKRLPAPWRHWRHAYALVAEIVSLSESGELAARTPYLLSTRLRDVVETNVDAFRLLRIHSPVPGLSPAEYPEAFASSTQTLAKWMLNEV